MTNETNFSEIAEDMHAAASEDSARRDAEENADAMREAESPCGWHPGEDDFADFNAAEADDYRDE